ncbi:MAG: YggS family pyridoxal phosphate-dependent enzyme [bacterium]
MLAENLRILHEKIAEKCLESGRNPSEITLIAVSKTMPVSMISDAFENGLLHFGENKAQEFRDKSILVGKPVIWHFIGHLQNNKVKYVVGKAEFIHSVDSKSLASEIADRALKIGIKQKILIEVKTSSDVEKFGISNFENVIEVVKFCYDNPGLELSGLMTMAPYTDDENEIRNCFSRLRILKEKLNSEGYNLKNLSMGMTNDFGIAIEEGATMLRIGTAIFGERDSQLTWKDK